MVIKSRWRRFRQTRGLTPVGRGFCSSVNHAIHWAAAAGSHAPSARRRCEGIHVHRDIPYQTSSPTVHTLDVYRANNASEPLPALVYVHGGAFTLCSKDTHWSLAVGFARRGFVVFNINYRLAPKHRYPAAINDTMAALEWVLEHGGRYGADTKQMVLVGESAGGNLVTSVATACSYRMKEPRARALFDSGFQPSAVVAACPVLQVSDTARFWMDCAAPVALDRWSKAFLKGMQRAYLGDLGAYPGQHALADPLLVLEHEAPHRPLPPLLTFAGDRDFLVWDCHRLKAAVDAHGGTCELRTYPNAHHAFHTLPWNPSTPQAWSDQLEFLSTYVSCG